MTNRTATITRLPLDPLIAYVSVSHGMATPPDLDAHRDYPHMPYPSIEDLQDWLGITRLKKVHAEGLTKTRAEDIADRLRVHPNDIWGASYWQCEHRYANGLTETDVDQIVSLVDAGLSYGEVGAWFQVPKDFVGRMYRAMTAVPA